MSGLELVITEKQLRNVPWQNALERADSSLCRVYNREFAREWEAAKEGDDEDAESVYLLLSGLTSLRFDNDSKSSPLTQREGFGITLRAFAIDDVADSTWDSVSKVLDDVSDSEMRARLGDVLWMVDRNWIAATEAVDAYLESVNVLRKEGKWHNIMPRLERAVGLAAQLDKTGDHFSKAISYIEDLLAELKGQDKLFLSADLIGLLLAYREGSVGKYTEYAAQKANEAADEKMWLMARRFWDLKSEWHRLEEDESARKDALRNLAETHVEEAELALDHQGGVENMSASSHLEKAIQAYRKVGGESDRIDELHQRLLRTQKASVDELGQFSTSIDLTGLAQSSIEAVEEKPFRDAITSLLLLTNPTNVEQAREQVEDLAQRYVFSSLMPALIMNEEGKTTAKQPSALTEDEEEAERSLRAQMFMHSRYHYQTTARGIILPALGQIRREHNVRIRDFNQLILNSPWIPNDRGHLYAKGFHAGLYGDWDVSAHLLIPQIEHSVRYVLMQNGHIPSHLDMSGIQDEYGLNATLHWDKTETILGEDNVFDLQSLLISRFGSNLRNRVAHGLVEERAFYTHDIVYLWWLTLRLCCWPLIVQTMQKGEEDIDPEQGNNSNDLKDQE